MQKRDPKASPIREVIRGVQLKRTPPTMSSYTLGLTGHSRSATNLGSQDLQHELLGLVRVGRDWRLCQGHEPPADSTSSMSRDVSAPISVTARPSSDSVTNPRRSSESSASSTSDSSPD